MNFGIYRLVLSASRGILMPVSENVSSRSSGKRSPIGSAGSSASRKSGISLWLPARASAFAALCAFGMQPIVAEAQATLPMTPDRSGSNHPVVGVSASGVPLVNIVAPNQSGVSLNNFTHYNVGTKGAVIVNTPRSVQTQIAGWVQGNPLMGNSHARLIINQVTSGNPTRLLGMTEIAGNRANLVIANPAGITCAGCGFINVPRVSLATARPAFNADGSLAGFDVTRGHLGVAGAGLDARGSAIDLIARAMSINAQVWAESIHATAGANQVGYATGTATSQLGEGEKPGIAIDVHALGGMYANSVRLVGTEAGVGVRNSGGVSSLTGNIELSANGDITIEPAGRIQSAGELSVGAPNLTNKGAIVGSRAVHLEAEAMLQNDGVIGALSNADLTSRDLINRGDVIAGVSAIGAPAGPGSVTLTGINVSSSGMLAAGDNVNVTGMTVSLDRGALYAASALNVKGDRSLTTREATAVASNTTLRSNGTFINDRGSFDTFSDTKIDARSVSNRGGGLSSHALTMTANGVDNTGGTLIARGRAQILATSLTNEGGGIGADDHLSIELSRDVSNRQGLIAAGNRLALSAGSLTSNTSGRIGSFAGDASLNFQQDAHTEGGLVIAAGNLDLDAKHLGNASGTIRAASARIDVSDFDNTNGVLETQLGKLSVSNVGDVLNDRGVIIGADGLHLKAQRLIANAEGQIGTHAGDATLTLAGNADNTHGLISSAGSLIFAGAALDNTSGRLGAAVARISTSDLTNTNGYMSARVGAMDVKSSGAVSNERGAVIGRSSLKLDAASLASNGDGQIGALDGNADVVMGAALTNAGGTLYARDTLMVRAEAIDNASGEAIGDSVDVTANRGLKNSMGRIMAAHKASLASETLDNQAGVIGAIDGPLIVATTGITDNERGKLLAGGDVALANAGLTNTDGVVSGADLDLKSGGQRIVNVGGVIEASGRLQSESGSLDNRRGQMRSVASVAPTPAEPDAAGRHSAAMIGDRTRDVTVTVGGNVDNTHGKILSAANLALKSQAFDNTSGNVQAGAARISTGQLNNLSGEMSTRSGQLDIESNGALSNAQGDLIGANGLKLDVASIASNEGGQIGSRGGEARITARAELNNIGGMMSAADTLIVRAGELDNTAGKALGDAIDAKADRLLANTDGRIVAARTANVETDKLVNHKGVIGAIDGPLTIATTGITDNGGGKLLAGGDVKLTNAGLANTDGVVSGASVGLKAGAGLIDNTRGVIDAAARIETDSAALDNRSGLIQSRGSAVFDMHGGTFDNRTAEGSEVGGRVIGKGVTLAAGGLRNTTGLISSSDETRVSAQLLTNDRGIILSREALALEMVGAVSNVSGQIGGDADVTLRGTRIDNTLGAVHAGQSLAVTGDKIVNAETKDSMVAPVSGLAALPAGMEGTTISLTATTDIDNSAGSVRSDQETNLKARTIGNTDGAITSSRRVLLSADATVTNSRGEINGGQMLRLSTGALNNDGRMESGGDVKIKTLDDFANLGVIVAGRDLDAHARGNVNNVGTMNARNVARISGRNIENDSGGEIMGDRGTHIHAEKSLFNRGLLDGGVTRVEAGDAATNVGRIYGDSASVGAQVVRNDADAQGVGGAIASRGNLDIGANVIENENGSLIYASNDIRTGRSLDADGRATDALSDRFTNNGALVDAGGHAKIAADRFENLNADFQTQKVTTDSGRQLWYTISGSTERLAPSDVHFYQRNNHEARAGEEYAWALDDDQKRLLLPSVRYPVSEYAKYTVNGTAGKIDNVRYPAIPRLYGDDYTVKQDADLVGVFRTVSDDMWAKFGVAPPPPPPDPSYLKAGNYIITLPLMGQRKLGADWYSLKVPIVQVQEQAGSPMTKLESCVTAATDGCRIFNEWYGKLDQSYTALSRAVNDYNSDVMSRAVDRWTIYDVSLKSTKDVVTATRPGRITTGGDLTIHAQSGINDKSQILAGGRAHLADAIQDNSQPKGVETFTALGQAITTWVESGGIRSGDQRKQDAQAYEAPLPAREIDLPIAAATTTNGDPVKRIAADAAAARGASGIRVTSAETKSIGGLLQKERGIATLHDRALTTVEGSGGLSEIDAQFRALPNAAREQAAAHKPADLLVHNGAHVRAIAQVDLGNIEIRTVEPNVKLPNNALYQVVSDPGRRYLIETDPRFTNHKHWLSSETMVAALSTDPGAVQKRLGDGFYEQQLIQQQIVEATGQRFIGNYTDNQTQYQALMANGAKAAKRFDMNVGTALTDAQMAALTEDIVWLVNREISLPDGTLQKVLVPQVYLRANAADVTGTGAIIAGGSVAIDNGGSLANSGTIASRRATIITADSITNVGTVAGDEVRADAKEDLRSLGGLIQGNAVSLSAGRDVRLSSTTSSITTENGSAMAIDRAPTTNAGTLAIQAGRDLHTEAAQVVSTGDVFLAAERDLNMAAIRQSSDESVRWSEKRRAARSASVDTGTAIVSDGNIGLIAGRDFSATAGSVSAGGSLSVVAGGDVNLSAGEQSASAYDEHYMTESRLFSSKSSHTIDESSHTDAIGTMLSGDTVDVLAGRNATAKAATIAGTGDVKLKAGNDLTITTAETASSEHHFRDVKKSGLGSAGAGISYGSNRATDTSRDTLRGARGSLIGSIDGNVSLRAGEKLHATGSTIIASQDVTGIAKEVKIDAARTDRRHEETHEMYSSGFTLAVKSPVIDAIQNVNRQAHGAANSGDGRAEALHAIAAGGGMSDLVGAAGGMSDALSSGQNPEAKIELSFGASRSKTTITEEATESDGSVVKAGRRAAFVATGSESAGQGNVTIEGSAVTAEDVLIRAADRVNLLSSADTASTRSTNESTSASVGVSFGTNGWGVSAAMSRAHGDANSDAVMHNNSHINAGNTATIVSGGDANILGANINATKVMGDIGGDLKIASMQDTSRSAARQSSAGGGFSISQGGGSASISVKSGRASGSYAGVHEQSGIQAGNGGFDIAVKGNTELKGAYIASTAKPEKNRLTTGTLSFSDIKNESSYRASSTGISAGGGVGDGGNNYATHGPTTGKNAGGALPLAVSESGGSDALTRSAVSAGAITIVDEANQSQDMSLLERDVTNLNGMVDKLPDLQDALSNQSDLVDASQAAAETVAREIGKYADKRERQAHDAARAETDPKLKAQYALEAQGWAEGGKSRVGLHIAGGALTGGLTGGGPGAVGGVAGAGLSATLGPKLDQLAQAIREAELTGNSDVDAVLGNLTTNLLAGGAGALVGGPVGAMTSAGTDRFNRQLHEDEKRLAKKIASDAKARGVRNADGSLITVDQIENAMRAANNERYGEFVASGVAVPLNADTKASDLYDTTGMQLKTDGSGHSYLVQDPSMLVAPTQTLQDVIVRNTGGADSPYSWNPPSTQTSTTPRLDPHGPLTPARNGCITAECAASVAPVGKINPNGVDYVSVQGNFYIASGGLSVNLHDGSLFWTVGQGRPYPAPSLKPGFSITAGSIFGGATAKETNEFLRGGGAGASTFLPLASPLIGIGGGVSHSYGGSTAIEIGIGTLGVSVNPITYGQPKRAED